MMRALTSGVAGLKVHQTKMDVIGNNIANVNTYGFKASRVSFKEAYYQTLNGSTDSNENQGGGNPTQVGSGSVLNTIDVLHTRGNYTPTGEAMDVFISGEGYLVARDAAGKERYTRIGILNFDGDGNLVDGNKSYICGYPISRYTEAGVSASVDGNVTVNFDSATGTKYQGYIIKITADTAADPPTAAVTPADPTTTPPTVGTIEIKAKNAPTAEQMQTAIRGATGGTPADLANVTVSASNSAQPVQLGVTSTAATMHKVGDVMFSVVPPKASVITAPRDITIDFGTANGAFFNGFKLEIKQGDADLTGDPGAQVNIDEKKITVTLDKDDTSITIEKLEEALQKMTAAGGGGEIPDNIKKNLNLITVKGTAGATLTTSDNIPKAANGADLIQSTVLDTTHGLQRIKKPGTLVDTDGDGSYDAENNDVISLVSIRVGENGIITGEDTNGQILQIGQIVLANVPNPQALTLDGDSYYSAESNTGTITYDVPGSGGVGGLVSGGLEGSNVDLANEFADMITTQRGFQANSRIFTVGDEMLQELINLKR